MGRLRFKIAMSLDGFVAGPNQSEEHPLGEGGMQLHQWAFGLASWRRPQGLEGGEVNASTDVLDAALDNVGATVMGRNMFGGRGPWGDEPWDGWWGDDPPFHHPVFVLTHHGREPLVKDGGTTFTFVTDGIESALNRAREAAGGKDVALGGGADVGQQCLRAGLVDQLQIHLVPILLGGRRPAVRRRRGRADRLRVRRRGARPGRHPPHLPGRGRGLTGREPPPVAHA